MNKLESYQEYTQKWRQFVENPDATITEEDWKSFFGQTNPVAGIDRGAFTDFWTNSQKVKIQTNEKTIIKENWSIISEQFRKLYKLTNDDEQIIQLKTIKEYIINLTKGKEGRRAEVATNRLLTTLFSDKLLSIPGTDDVEILANLLEIPTYGKDWIDLCFEIRPTLESLFPYTMHWDAYQSLVQENSLQYSILKNYNLILTGAPGTGKTYLARQMAARIIGCKEDELDKNEQFEFIQFHPSYDYTDFVEGLRPIKDQDSNQIVFERQDGIFKSFCKNAAQSEILDDKKKYVFVIDEINRGEISKIFGELFFSIDPGYRSQKERILVKTQYHNLIPSDKEKVENYPFKSGFYVPSNVYVIGTMNDIDRSVESMDFAFRRRFSFHEVQATDTQESILKDCADKDDAIKKMNSLNSAIEDIGLSSAYHIGAAYFKKVSLYKGDRRKWGLLWDNHIKGLLYEYLRGLPSQEIKNKLDSLKKAYKNQGETSAPETDTSITTQP